MGAEAFINKYHSAYVKRFPGGILPRNITIIPRSQLTLDEARCEPVIAEALVNGVPRVYVEETKLKNWYDGLLNHEDSERLLKEYGELQESLKTDITRYLLDLSVGYQICVDITDYEALRAFLIEDATHRRTHEFYSSYDAMAAILYGKTSTEISPLISICESAGSIAFGGKPAR